MKSIAKLKDEARKHEQREEWEKAIQVYLQVLQVGEEGEGEVELPLYNRVGDLCVRLGRPHEAVRHYEQAADRYAEAGLYNNAIALCNKALRYAPDYLPLMKKLGQFSASQGFITDARRYFLEYAEKQFTAGQVDEALSALEDFANVSDDADVREMLGHRLHAHGRSEEAVQELQRAYSMRVEAGEHDRAEAVRAAIAAIDPNVPVDGGGPPPPLPQLDEPEPEQEPAADELPGLADIDQGASLAGFDIDTSTADTGTIAGFETGRADDEAEPAAFETIEISGFEDTAPGEIDVGGLEGLEPTTLDLSGVEDIAVDADLGIERDETSFDLPMLDSGDDAPGLPDADDDGFDLPALDEDAGFELPTLDGEGDEASAGFVLPTLDEEAGTFDLPTLDDEAAGTFDLPTLDDDRDDGAAFTFRDVDAPAASAMPELVEETQSIELPSLDGDGDGAFELPSLGADGDGAFELPSLEADEDNAFELPALDAEEEGAFDVPSLDAAADVAGDAADEAAADLTAPEAEEPAAPGAPPPADEGWTPEMSLPAAPPAAPKPTPAPAKPAAPEGGFVDLGALLSEDDEETTRFRVQETAPTGDEDRDFAELLSQFKAKVSEHLPPEDAAAHYDLGIAFKEMGLIDEAISEFQIALRAGHMKLKVYEELGHCFLQKEQYNIAEKVLRRALEMKFDDEIELLGVYYHLGRAYEGMGRRDQARDAYERVLGMDINFQDVTDRLARL